MQTPGPAIDVGYYINMHSRPVTLVSYVSPIPYPDPSHQPDHDILLWPFVGMLEVLQVGASSLYQPVISYTEPLVLTTIVSCS